MSEQGSEDRASTTEVSAAGAGTEDTLAAPARRPRPGPTSRARRASAAGSELHRPAPGPAADRAADRTAPARPKPGRPAGPGGTERATPAAASAPARSAPAQSAPERSTPARSADDRAGRRAPIWLAAVLGVLVVVAAAALIVVSLHSTSDGSATVRDEALSAAKSEVPLLLSYDYKNFDASVAKAKATLTGQATSDYTKAMTTSIKPTALKVKATVVATTDGAGIESVSPDGQQVTAVVFGEQKVTNTNLSAPRTDLFRVRATLDLVKGHWLISKFDNL